jgi:fatty acid desaturase
VEKIIGLKDLLASLSRDERKRLLERSDAPGLIRFAVHGGLIAAGSLWVGLKAPLWPLLLPLQGVLLAFLFTALHEATHKTAFRSNAFNLWVARICGFLLLIPPLWFRFFHFAHHRFTQDPDQDPELVIPKPRGWMEYLWRLSGLPFWGSMIKILAVNAVGRGNEAFLPESREDRNKVKGEAQVMLGLYIGLFALSVLLESALLVWIWILPALIGQPALRAYLLAEHNGCPQSGNMLANSRTVYTNALVRFFAWNMPYHAEHHAYPAVPFHKLPLFHEITRLHLQVTEQGYLQFHRKLVAGFSARG